ncbi:nuclease-related domain-containing protein [Cryobacterium roopkundense]|uniref:NERD domain-containing protein n=1 Tax=Cryobacterium roopkundense TaxID=1001240 RepID=A0A7W8ZU45_9MICO|nr:nuclease-related domain-containing protein [Cryobacterium roopkundense]MBB5639902.1 hypothetical protein [Cryobacterium roopkundense]
MSEQIAAQSVIEELLREQQTLPPRSHVARLWGRSPLAADSVAWYLGALGEIEVGKVLSRLPPQWRVFHALPIGKADADIDHLVIGPGGIFTINTKHHRGKKIWVAERSFMVNGQKQAHLRNSKFEATRVTKMLCERMPQLPPAQAVIALVSPGQITIKSKPDAVQVLDSNNLRRWLLKGPAALSEVELVELTAIIDAPSTWSAPTSPPTPNLKEQFTMIDREVRTARVRRVSWTLFSFAVVATLVVFVGIPLYAQVVTEGIGSL